MSTSLPSRAMGTPRFEPRSNRGVVAAAVMVGFHLIVGYLLASGLGHKAIQAVKRPLTATLIEEVKVPEPPPPPPPPPPKPVQATTPPPNAPAPFVPPPEVAPPAAAPAAMAMETTAKPPDSPVVIQPPAPAPVAAGPRRVDIGVACPTQVAPELPKRALEEGTSGVVRAQLRIRDGVVQSVDIISGPRIFHASVRAAIGHYKCVSGAGQDITAVQEFNFKVE